MSAAPATPTRHLPPNRAGGRAAALLALAWFLLTLPLLGRSEWEDDMENLAVATALETHWTGHRFAPTLQGVTRLNKPPLTTWLTALAISPKTAADLASPDPAVRHAARDRLAFESRIPAHAMAALTILVAYGLGRVTLGTGRAGLLAAAACATMLLFTRYMRYGAYDVPLTLFTALAQLCLAHWLFEGRRILGAIGGGLALGLAILSKGPIVLLFAVAPILVYLPLAKRRTSPPLAASRAQDSQRPSRLTTLALILLLIALTILPTLPWVLAVMHEDPSVWSRWYAEITRDKPTAAPWGKWYSYVEVLRLALPWTPWVIAGCVLAWRDTRQHDDDVVVIPGRGREGPTLEHLPGRRYRALLAFAWVIVPLIVMSFARDRKPHYLLPLAAPLAVLAARSLDEFWRTSARRLAPAAVIVLIAHWCGVIGIGAALWLDRHPDPTSPVTPSEITCAAIAALATLIGIARPAHRPPPQSRSDLTKPRDSSRGPLSPRATLVTTTVVALLALRWLDGLGHDPVSADRVALRQAADAIWRTLPPDADVLIHDTSGGPALAVQNAAEFQVALGRVVRWTPHPPPAPPTKPTALILVDRVRATTRPAPADGWQTLARFDAPKKVTFELRVPDHAP